MFSLSPTRTHRPPSSKNLRRAAVRGTDAGPSRRAPTYWELSRGRLKLAERSIFD